jgi:hypothetical protein
VVDLCDSDADSCGSDADSDNLSPAEVMRQHGIDLFAAADARAQQAAALVAAGKVDKSGQYDWLAKAFAGAPLRPAPWLLRAPAPAGAPRLFRKIVVVLPVRGVAPESEAERGRQLACHAAGLAPASGPPAHITMMLVTDRYWGAAITSKQVEAVRAAVKAAAGRSFLAASDVGGSSYGTVDPEGAFVGLRREMVRAAAAAAEAERPGSSSFGFGSTDGEGEGAIVEWHSSSGLRSAVLPARALADLGGGGGGGGGGAAPPPHHATAWARAQARAGALFWDLRLDGVIVNAQPAPLACNEDVFHALQWCRADNSQTASRVARADHDVAANPMAKIQGVGRKRGKLVAAVLARLRKGERPGVAPQ